MITSTVSSEFNDKIIDTIKLCLDERNVVPPIDKN